MVATVAPAIIMSIWHCVPEAKPETFPRNIQPESTNGLLLPVAHRKLANGLQFTHERDKRMAILCMMTKTAHDKIYMAFSVFCS